MSNEKKAIRTVYFSIASNLGLAIVKSIAGVLGNSFALIADGIESASDIFSSILVLLGFHYAKKPADKNHPYGHGKIEPLITFCVVVLLLISAVFIAYQSILNINTPHELPKPWTLIVLGAIILWKELSFQLVNKKSKETNSSSLKADAWHHRSDAISSLMAFLGIGLALLLGEGFETADDWAALFAAGIIIYNSFLIFRPALGELMDEQLHDEVLDKIRRHALEVEGIMDTEKCFIRKTGMYYYVDLHAIVDGNISVQKGHLIAHNLQDHLMEHIPNLVQVLIHVEPDKFSPQLE